MNSTSTVLWELGRVTAPATRLRDRRQQERIVAPQTSWPWRIGVNLVMFGKVGCEMLPFGPLVSYLLF